MPPSSRLTGVRVSAARRHHLAAGPVGAGELDVVDVVDQRRAGLAGAEHAVEDVGGADLLLPGLDHFDQAEGGELGGLDDDRGARLQGRDRVAEGHRQREVPGADHADDRDGAGTGSTSFFEAISGEWARTVSSPMNFVRLGPVEVDQVGDVDQLGGGVAADLAGFGLHRVGDLLGVVEHPVAQLAEPVVAALDAERLPLGLVGAHPGDGRGDRLGRVDLDRVDRLPGRGVEDVDRSAAAVAPLAPFVALARCSCSVSAVPLSTWMLPS